MIYEPGQMLAYEDGARFGLCKVIKVTKKADEEIVSLVIYRNWFEGVPKEEELVDLSPFIIHVPVGKNGMDQSGCVLLGTAEVCENELKSYQNWFDAWKQEKAGYFPISISAGVNHIVEAKSESILTSKGQNSSQTNMFRERFKNEGFPF